MVMIFANEKVREYLLEHGLVYTFRTYHRKTADGVRPQTGKDWAAAKRTGKKIADIDIEVMEPIDCLNMGHILTKYARESGFYGGHGRVDDAVDEWARAINKLNPKAPTQDGSTKLPSKGLMINDSREGTHKHTIPQGLHGRHRWPSGKRALHGPTGGDQRRRPPPPLIMARTRFLPGG